MVKNVPAARKKAEYHFKRSIAVAEEVGAKGWIAQSYMDLGLLHKAKKQTEQAKECIAKAMELFKQCEAEFYLKQAKEIMSTLDHK